MTTDLRPAPLRQPGPESAHGSRWLLPALAVLLTAACAGTGGSRSDDADPMAALERRALERWQLMIERKPELAYDYLTPGYRATRTREVYAATPRNPALTINSASWSGADCPQPDSCEARLLLDYSFVAPQAGKIPGIQEVTERWLRLDGTWYHLPTD